MGCKLIPKQSKAKKSHDKEAGEGKAKKAIAKHLRMCGCEY